MRHLIISVLIVAAACNNSKSDKLLPGVYSGHFEHEYGINDDTLILRKANDGNNIFNLTRHTGTIRKSDGKQFPKKQSTENLILEFTPDTKILNDLRQGRILIWNSTNLTLQLGTTTYKKISD